MEERERALRERREWLVFRKRRAVRRAPGTSCRVVGYWRVAVPGERRGHSRAPRLRPCRGRHHGPHVLGQVGLWARLWLGLVPRTLRLLPPFLLVD